jgi:hypothetical protein
MSSRLSFDQDILINIKAIVHEAKEGGIWAEVPDLNVATDQTELPT